MTAIIIIICIVVLAGIYQAVKSAGIDKMLSGLSGFHVSEKYKGPEPFSKNAIAIDKVSKRIAVINSDGKTYVYEADTLISAEILVDKKSISKHNTDGVGVGFGGLAFGTSRGTSVHLDKVKEIVLRLTFNNLNAPSQEILFLSGSNYRSSKSRDVVRANEFIKHWYSLMLIVIDTNSKISASSSSGRSGSASSFDTRIADELAKLHDLKEKGILTVEEFDRQKQRLLA